MHDTNMYTMERLVVSLLLFSKSDREKISRRLTKLLGSSMRLNHRD